MDSRLYIVNVFERAHGSLVLGVFLGLLLTLIREVHRLIVIQRFWWRVPQQWFFCHPIEVFGHSFIFPSGEVNDHTLVLVAVDRRVCVNLPLELIAEQERKGHMFPKEVKPEKHQAPIISLMILYHLPNLDMIGL